MSAHACTRLSSLTGMTVTASPPGPRLLDALSLLSEVTDQLVVRSVRDTHLAWADRAHGVARRASGGGSTLPEVVHRGIAGAVYAGLGVGLRGAAAGFDRLASTGIGPGLEDGPRGRFVSSAVNGLIGDRLLRERPQLAIPMAARVDGHDVDIDRRRAGGGVPRGDGSAGRLPARALRERGLLELPPRPHRHDVRRGAGRPRLDPGLPARQHRPPAAGERRRPGGADAAAGGRLAGAGHPGRAGRTLAGWPGDARGRGGGGRASRVGQRLEPAGQRRDHARHAAPRRPDRLGDRPRQPRARRGARDGGVRPDPRLALGRRARPRGRAGRGRARRSRTLATTWCAPRSPRRVAIPSATWWATTWSGRGRRTDGTGAVGGCSRTPTCCTWAAPTTSVCSTIPEIHRAMEDWLA